MNALERAILDRILANDAVWLPQPGPQLDALLSPADELFYGGAAGGGKSDLLLGCALTQHQKAVIFRRVYPNLVELIERSMEIVGDSSGYNRNEATWRLPGCRLEFESCQYEHDKKKQQGRPRDFYGFDEITEFIRSQFLFVTGWNRTTDIGQRCRVIVTGNPPSDDAGAWVVEEWAPWLDSEFPAPAAPGELRWFYHKDEQHIVWLKSGEPVEVDGNLIYPRSRTFIPAKLEDNPYLTRDNRYRSVIESMPEPLRSIMKGDFQATAQPDPWQAIPAEWVRLAQRRWLEREQPAIPPSGVGIDVARGGPDRTVITKRYDNYLARPAIFPGSVTPDGPAVAAKTAECVEAEPGYVNVDLIGVGTSAFDSIKPMYQNVNPVNVAMASNYRDRSGRLKMRNLRAEMYWRMREALDPEHGDDLALPPGNEIVADLCAARYTNTTAGITIEDKEKIKERIGRSPDVGEAIMLALLDPGAGWSAWASRQGAQIPAETPVNEFEEAWQ